MTTTKDSQPVSRFWTKLGLVADIARILREKPAGRKTLDEVLQMINRVVSFDSATLYLMDRKRDVLDEVASFGRSVNILEFLQFGKGAGLAGWVAKQKEPVSIRGRDSRRSGVREHHDSVLILPLLVGGNLIGVLCFSHPDPDGFDENRQKLLEVVSDQVAISIERIVYQKELEARNRALIEAQAELKEAQDKLIAQEKLSAVAELAVSVSHEVNNPLSIIVGNAQLIELEVAEMPPGVIDRIRAIVDGARRISLITHKLLKVDRLVTEDYLHDGSITMLNIHKSSGND
ncbi:MAG: GAF domain-containing protein [FCB group bacterium]|nr:GAF domain-containing protein [FCB group bacterium]